MIRSELIQQLSHANPGLTARELETIVSAFFDTIANQLARGGRIELRGFGAFSTRAREGRTGRNPRTGSTVVVAPKSVAYFKPGKEIRDRLNA